MNHFRRNGFTLLEMLLVTAIISIILLMVIGYITRKGEEYRRDKAVMQVQQTLNAGLAFYVDYGRWPYCGGCGCALNTEAECGAGTPPWIYELTELGYLPKIHTYNPWGGEISYSAPGYKNFSVCIWIPPSPSAAAIAASIAGRLPMGFTSATEDECFPDKIDPTTPCQPGEGCMVMASVNIPGQNLNNARSINFAGIYQNGGCVPVPTCPSIGPNTMKPAIITVPSSVSGMAEGAGGTVYPLESFTAYATDIAKGGPPDGPEKCTIPGERSPCQPGPTGHIEPDQDYWRVCLEIVTEKGKLEAPNWSEKSGYIAAFTRCVPRDEPIGSSFEVFESF